MTARTKAKYLIDRSFLTDELMEKYFDLYKNKLARLSIT